MEHSHIFESWSFSRSLSTDSLEPKSSDATSFDNASTTAMSLGDLANLPMEVIYCMFEVMDPCAVIGFALTNKDNMSIYTQWLDTASLLRHSKDQSDPHEMFDFIRKRICKMATTEQRQEAAAALRLWQRRVLQDRSPVRKWNVCNGCLEFKPDHCKSCVDEICPTFVCHPYCIL